MIREPGGIHISEALKRGDEVIAAQTGKCLDQIDAYPASVETLFADPGHDPEEM